MSNVSVDISQQLNITCRKGDTFVLDLTITASDGSAINMIGYGGALLVKDNQGTSIISFFTNLATNRTIDDTYNSSNHGLITMAHDGTNNVVRFTATSTLMAAVESGSYVYDFAVQYGSDNIVTTYTKGNFIVNADV